MSQEIMTSFKFNDVEYEFDIRDADDAEKFEQSIEALKSDGEKAPKTGKLSEIYRAQCGMIKKFFDNCLGEGAGVAICSAKNNVTVCYKAYDEFLDLVRQQKEDVLRAKNTFGKYSNRQQRRAADRQKK